MPNDRQMLVLCAILLLIPSFVLGQSTNATITGQVADSSKAIIPQATIRAINNNTNVRYEAKSNVSGAYVLTSLPPGSYRLEVEKMGFRTIIKPDIVLHVQDTIELNFEMAVGSAAETVTVEAGAPLVNSQDATVSTVVDRNFAENLPMNGRSFQTLIDLTPGVVVAATNTQDNGQFTINGQRASSNYWMVDGVSANIGISSSFNVGNGLAGAIGSTSVLGGTNSLVSIDAMQEFRIQTSSYAPEFGRTPGGQISILTRSGTNQLHGTLFEYLRNDALDASNWFDGYGVQTPLPKAQERQNDFGGTFSGPILKNKTFFFFSYEGLRLRLPQTTLTTVPDLAARQSAPAAQQLFLNAFPIDSNQPDLGNGVAQFNASYSNPASLDAYSLRIDHELKQATLFARYNYSPSTIAQRGNGAALSTVSPQSITTQTATFGVMWPFSSTTVDELKFNYSRTNAEGRSYLDNFGGATSLTSLPFPTPFNEKKGTFQYGIISLTNGIITAGKTVHQQQRQLNLIDNLSLQKTSHSLKFGLDFRQLSPIVDSPLYSQGATFLDVPSAETGSLYYYQTISNRDVTFHFHNLGVFAQDTWRALPNLTLTYGLRWDSDFAPSTSSSARIPRVTGYSRANLSDLALAPDGPPFNTSYGNIAPRIGVAYQVSKVKNWETVVRGGGGVFYDLATSGTGNFFGFAAYPFSGSTFGCCFSATFPLSPETAAPPTISASSGIVAFDPNVKLPYTLEWNVAVEQALGKQQSLSTSYIGAVGRRLLQSAVVFAPNAKFQRVELIGNTATSDYHALQVQFKRSLSRGLQTLGSYTLSHSIDDASAGSVQDGANTFVPNEGNRGSSSFDIRHTFSLGVTYDTPVLRTNTFTKVILGGWSIENALTARSAPPVDVSESFQIDDYSANVRPDVISGVPLYLYGPQYPGGKIINNTPGAVVGGCPDGSESRGPFCPPPLNPVTFAPSRQGTLPRNGLRGFGAAQWDLAVHRDFPVRESLKLQFRAEMFNVLNHPNFGSPDGNLFSSTFGKSTQTLGQYLSGGNLGGGALSSLYQLGGPRSIQIALKLVF